MHRQSVLQLLEDYRRRRPEEAAVVDRIVRLIREHEDCFLRTCRPGHLTGSAWVVSADGRRRLLLHHRKLNKWLQPGGHADGQTDLSQVALREAEEETGLTSLEVVPAADGLLLLDVDVHEIPARLGPGGRVVEDAHEHHDLRFLIRATGDETLVQNDESNELRWLSDSEVRKLTTEASVLRLLEKAQARLS